MIYVELYKYIIIRLKIIEIIRFSQFKNDRMVASKQ